MTHSPKIDSQPEGSQSANSQPNIYALLIGINHYVPNSLYSDLRGCVRDIDLVNTYLSSALNVPEDRIWRLTAPNPDESYLEELRSATDKLPTYRNIVEAFNAVTAAASAGDQIYIHYSGHGGRAKTLYSGIKGDLGQWDESIVPTDFCSPGGRYLHDVELATLLKRMTDNQAIVTIILDSCHSGGATRGESNYDIRGPQDDRVDNQEPDTESLVAEQKELEDNWRALTSGTMSSDVPWLPPSRDYVCLAACRPSEKAREYPATQDGDERNGALTFWMIDTLTNNPVPNLDYRSLHERVSAKIQGLFSNQVPVLMGEDNRVVFGTDLVNRRYTAQVLNVDAAKQQVELQVGQIHGMSRGARFSIYPRGTKEFLDSPDRLAIVEVSQLEPTTCFAKTVLEADGGQVADRLFADPEGLKGAPAVMDSTPAALKRRVRLIADKKVGEQGLDSLPASLVSQQGDALKKVHDALLGNGWLTEVGEGGDGTQSEDFQVSVDRNGDYEIWMDLPIKNLRPPTPINAPGAAQTVVDRLVHLAKYQSVQAIDNPTSRLTGYLKVDLMQQPGWQSGDPFDLIPFENPQAIEVEAGSYAFLRIENLAGSSLNIAVMDLEPTWEISQISFLNLSSTANTLAPKETQIIPLCFSLPSDEDDQLLYSRASETLKVFAALGTVEFSWLRLPKLDEKPDPKIADERNAKRSSSNSALNTLMSAIGAKKPKLTRASTPVRDPNQEWTTKQIHFTITQPR